MSPRPGRTARRTIVTAVAAVTFIGATAGPAGATWSVVAVDPGSGEVGVALASCVPAEILGRPGQTLVPIVLVPGRLAAVVQGQFNAAVPDRVEELAAAGVAPDVIVGDVSSPAFDAAAPTRQLAVVSFDGSAAFSGEQLQPEALHRAGRNVSVQGNLLASADAIPAALEAFETAQAGGADLPAALVAALEAGSDEGGDRRCPGQTALFAQVAVAHPDDDPLRPSTLLTVTVDQGDGQNPVTLLSGALADGRSGLVRAGQEGGGGGRRSQAVALVVGVALAAGGVVAFRRGLGSVRARR